MKCKMSLAIDMSNAVSYPKVDNFTVLLLRLIMKADSDNRMLLRNGFPVEVKMVEIFQTRCPYLEELDTDGMRKVDYKKLVDMADEEDEGTWDCRHCGLSGLKSKSPQDKCIRCGRAKDQILV